MTQFVRSDKTNKYEGAQKVDPPAQLVHDPEGPLAEKRKRYSEGVSERRPYLPGREIGYRYPHGLRCEAGYGNDENERQGEGVNRLCVKAGRLGDVPPGGRHNQPDKYTHAGQVAHQRPDQVKISLDEMFMKEEFKEVILCHDDQGHDEKSGKAEKYRGMHDAGVRFF